MTDGIDMLHGWRCMVCGDTDRAFDQISVACHPSRVSPELFKVNVSYCNDRDFCTLVATAPGPWPPIEWEVTG